MVDNHNSMRHRAEYKRMLKSRPKIMYSRRWIKVEVILVTISMLVAAKPGESSVCAERCLHEVMRIV